MIVFDFIGGYLVNKILIKWEVCMVFEWRENGEKISYFKGGRFIFGGFLFKLFLGKVLNYNVECWN